MPAKMSATTPKDPTKTPGIDPVGTPAKPTDEGTNKSPTEIPTVLKAFNRDELPAGSDPVLIGIDAETQLVNFNDKCAVNIDYARKLPILVKWKQLTFSKSDTYYVLGFINKTARSSCPALTRAVCELQTDKLCSWEERLPVRSFFDD